MKAYHAVPGYHAVAVRICAFLAGLLAALAAAACNRTPARAPEPAAPRPKIEARESYRPPADGRLTAAQVEKYLAVWKHVPEPTPPPGLRATPYAGRTAALGDVTEAATPDVRVARDQGWSAGEYLWVRERILEAEAARTAAKLNADVLAMLEKTLADLKAHLGAATDEGSRTLLNEQIASFSDEAARVRREAAAHEPEAVRANLRTLEPFRGKLDAIRDQIDRVYAVVSGAPPPKRPRESRPAR